MKYMVVSWDYVDALCKRIAIDILKDGFDPDLIVALAKGGWFVGSILSDYLGSELVSLDIRKDRRIEGGKVLVVDDFINTGSTMRKGLELITARELRTAALLMLEDSDFIPHYLGEYMMDYAWVIFPWNFVEDLSNLVLEILKEGEVSQSKLKREMMDRGLDPITLDVAFPGRFEELMGVLEIKGFVEKRVDDGRVYWRICDDRCGGRDAHS